jgi:hypothetical protein
VDLFVGRIGHHVSGVDVRLGVIVIGAIGVIARS